MYKFVKDVLKEEDLSKIIYHKVKQLYIPFDEGNTDYQEYLEWLAEGNTPEPSNDE